MPNLQENFRPNNLTNSDQSWIHPFFYQLLPNYSIFLNEKMDEVYEIFLDPDNQIFYSESTTRKILEGKLHFYGRIPNMFLIILAVISLYEILERIYKKKAIFLTIGFIFNFYILHFSSIITYQLISILFPVTTINLLSQDYKFKKYEYFLFGLTMFMYDNKIANILPALGVYYFINRLKYKKENIPVKLISVGIFAGLFTYLAYLVINGQKWQTFLLGSHGLYAFFKKTGISEFNSTDLFQIWKFYILSITPVTFILSAKLSIANIRQMLRSNLKGIIPLISIMFLTGPILPSLSILRKGKFWAAFISLSTILTATAFKKYQERKVILKLLTINTSLGIVINILLYIKIVLIGTDINLSFLL
jgi:hypothetical protein